MSRVSFTLDVLSDGSEFTGPTLFLSVWKRPRTLQSAEAECERLQETMELGPPLARYAIAGLGDAVARLCADQRFKLSPTRAVFVPSMAGANGLSTLLFALLNAGSPSLHVVSDDSLNVEELASIILGNHRHLNIQTCHVPSQRQWWKVYDDEHLTVHAQMSHMPGSIIYLYSVRLQNDSSNTTCTIAILPTACEDVATAMHDLKSEDLPLCDDEERITIDYVLALDPKSYDPGTLSPTARNAKMLVTLPSSSVHRMQNATPDSGLLIHAQKIAKYFATQMPWAFPSSPSEPQSLYTGTSPFEPTNSNPFVLRSCTSVLLGTKSLISIDRRRDIWNRSLSDEWSTTLTSLQSLIPNPTIDMADENEISLVEESDSDGQEEEEQRTSKPQLVVLGTGCASPSAIRGASGYALVVPKLHDEKNQEVFLMDGGEGVTTMLHRLCRHVDWVHNIVGIWISHAHLDHYGGLPTLVQTISCARRQAAESNTQIESAPPLKRPRVASGREAHIPWIMAPPKVLHYLDIILNCKHGLRKRTSTSAPREQMFIPLLHQDPTMPAGPWSHFQNIKVYHNCCPSYGLLLRVRKSWLCYSGDSRPCRSLVTACRRHRNLKDELLLIHEATFAEAEQDQAEAKKHSTVAEALSIALQIPATRVLLTHFSQRYLSMDQPSQTSSNNREGKELIPMGYAIDGLQINL